MRKLGTTPRASSPCCECKRHAVRACCECRTQFAHRTHQILGHSYRKSCSKPRGESVLNILASEAIHNTLAHQRLQFLPPAQYATDDASDGRERDGDALELGRFVRPGNGVNNGRKSFGLDSCCICGILCRLLRVCNLLDGRYMHCTAPRCGWNYSVRATWLAGTASNTKKVDRSSASLENYFKVHHYPSQQGKSVLQGARFAGGCWR